MQQRLLVLLALLAAPAVATTASSTATAWLQSHKSPTDDQLGELKGSNPAAFAIVQALLSKHSKGEVKLTAEERGPDVFKAMMTPRHFSKAHDEPAADVPYASAELAEVRHPVVDQKNFNPDAAADRDESSVSRLLAAVAQMGGDKAKKIGLINAKRTHGGQAADTSNSLQADANFFAEDDSQAPAVSVQKAEEEAAEAVQVPVEAPPAPKKKKNSYLDGLDLTGDMPVATARKHTVQQEETLPDSLPTNLASFSFDEAAATPAPKKVAAPKKTNNVFLKWLSDSKKRPAPQAEEEQQAPAQPVQQEAAKASNPYANWMTF